MAYVLGFFAADGNIVKTNRDTHFLSFYSSDQNLIENIRTIMKSEHKISKRNYKGGECFRLQIGSREMFQDLLYLGITVNKSRRMRVPCVPSKYTNDFVRGYFDGDGNVWTGLINKKTSNPHMVLQVAFTSSSTKFLLDFLELLRCLGVSKGAIYPVKENNCSRLQLSTLDALKLYKIMYNVPHRLSLSRKKLVFEKFIKLRCDRSSTG